MLYHFSLQQVGFAVGALLVGAHLWALVQPDKVRGWLRGLPRSRGAAAVLLALVAIWAFWIALVADFGEFNPLRRAFLVLIPVGYFLVLKFVDELLSARALGALGVLAAEPLLEAAFLRPETSRLLLVVLAYVWATVGMFWVGLPYLMRDWIAWVDARPVAWRILAVAGTVYGALILAAAFSWGGA